MSNGNGNGEFKTSNARQLRHILAALVAELIILTKPIFYERSIRF